MKTYKEMADSALERIKKHNQKRRKIAYFITSIISIFLLTFVFQMLLFNKSDLNDKTLKENYPKIITGYPTNVIHMYLAPKNGQFYCFNDVIEAREYYASQNVKYLLIIHLFSEFNNDYREITKDEIVEEYQRLSNEGYDVYLLTDEFDTVIIGLFTDEELDNFEPNDKYGYAFRFVSQDSQIEINDLNAIIKFDTKFE